MEISPKISYIPESRIMSVSKLTDYIAKKLKNDQYLIGIWVRGEISNYVKAASGHIYFTLKDELNETSEIKCVMFGGSNSSLKFEPENGMKVLVLASIGVHKSYYELIVSEIHPDGLGALYQKFLQLKDKLEKEGLFSSEHKKPIPKFPKTIGVITSPTGAALRDLIRILTSRFPSIKIKLVPALVQGVGAAKDIVRSIELLNRVEGIEVIILGRGGGSLEDLWCFNEEIVARAIFKSEIPIISAIGHETDFTISDLVADCRASTPSNAAEIAVPDKDELLSNINHLRDKLLLKTRRIVDFKRQNLRTLIDRPLFKRPFDFINEHLQQLDDLMLRSGKAILVRLKLKREVLEGVRGKLHSLDPKAVLDRGYSVVMYEGKILKKSSDIKINDLLDIILQKGQIKSKVTEVKNGK